MEIRIRLMFMMSRKCIRRNKRKIWNGCCSDLKKKSDDMVLVQSDIDEVLKRVCLIYENNETLIRISNGNSISENKSYAYDVEDKKVKEEQIIVDGNKIDIIQYKLDDGNKENVAHFTYKDVFYTINTTMNEEKFKELLKNLYFF